jgi:hypothetical protein
MSDPNMELAFHFAKALGSAPPLPAPLSDLSKMTDMMLSINGGLTQDPYFQGPGNAGLLVPIAALVVAAERIRNLAEATKDYMPGLDPLQRVNVALRLWAGCLDAAKIVSDVTSSGKNDAAERKKLMPVLLARAAECSIYAAGVPAGPAVRKRRGQPVIYEGIEEHRDGVFRDPLP